MTLFSAGLLSDAQEPAAAKQLMQFLAAAAAVAVIKQKGMEPRRLSQPSCSWKPAIWKQCGALDIPSTRIIAGDSPCRLKGLDHVKY